MQKCEGKRTKKRVEKKEAQCSFFGMCGVPNRRGKSLV